MRGWRWLAPAVVVLLVVTAWPICRAVWTSLHTQALTNPGDRSFVGLDTYGEVLTTRAWWIAVATTLAVVAVSVVLQLLLGLAFAAAMRRLDVLWPLTRVLVLVPFAMLSVVAAVVGRDAVTTGFAAEWFDIDDLGPTGQLVAVSLGEVWRGAGITAVILLAGLLRVSPSLLASAVADGATPWQRVHRVVLPAMAPAIAVAATYRALDALRVLEGPLLVAEPTSDVRTVPALVWDATFSRFEVGLGAATSVLLLVLAALVAAALVPLLRVRRVM
jgi:multiple sugar transport system permease protein